jgi:hypothetical protein
VAHEVNVEGVGSNPGWTMLLFWIVNDERRVLIRQAGALIFARLHAGIAGFDGV